MPLHELAPHLVYAQGTDAILHLVRVTSGLDSLIVGENHILGQIRLAFREAMESSPIPCPLVGIFERSLQAARRVRAESPRGQHPSVATTGVDFALSVQELRERPRQGLKVLVVGAGVMASSALAHLTALDIPVLLLNRTVAHADQLARRHGSPVTVADFESLPESLGQADLVVCATASRRPVLDLATLRAALNIRPTRPLVVLDLGVPRNVEPSVRSEQRIRLLDMDDLEQLCPVDPAARAEQQTRLEARAVEEAQRIDAWLRVRARAPQIVRLRAHGEEVRSRELQRVATRLRDLSPDQMGAVEELTDRIVNKLLHAPTVALREGSSRRVRPIPSIASARQAFNSIGASA
jgi:glutamyl-tRNA reductase